MPRQHFNWKKKSEKHKFKYQNFLFLLTKHTQTLTKKKSQIKPRLKSPLWLQTYFRHSHVRSQLLKPQFLPKQKLANVHLLVFLSILTLSHSQQYLLFVPTTMTLTLWVNHFNLGCIWFNGKSIPSVKWFQGKLFSRV